MNTLITVEAWNLLVGVRTWLATDLINKVNYATALTESDFLPLYDARKFLDSHKFDLETDFYEQTYDALNNGVSGSLDDFFDLLKEQMRLRDAGISDGREEIHEKMTTLYNKLVKDYEQSLRKVQPVADEARSKLPAISLPSLKTVGGGIIIGSPNSTHGAVSSNSTVDSSVRSYSVSHSQVGVLGDKNQSGNVSNEGLSFTAQEMQQLATELLKLRKELAAAAETAEHFESAGAIARAQEAAKKGDDQSVISNLKQAGKWALGIATSVGIPIAVEALKKVVHL